MQIQSARTKRFFGLISTLALSTATLPAHPLHINAGGLSSGLLHPLFGLDHILAMIAVGLWAGQMSGRALWLVPGSFLAMVVVGATLGFASVPMPFVEQGIVASIVVLGLFIAVAARLPVWIAAALVGLFALFHGHAHASELLPVASALAYTTGFVLATAGLHLVGIGLSVFAQRRDATIAVRWTGASLLVAGLLSHAA
jgi:urease accessory protein